MTRRIRWTISLLALFVIAAFSISACGDSQPQTATTKSDTTVDADILAALRAKYPLPILTDSSDLSNQIEYAKVQSDPSKVEYLEFLSYSGSPIGFFTIKGQVSAESTRITSPVKDNCQYSGDSGVACVQDPQPDLTGTYFSQDGGGYFAYLTDGALIQWPASVQFFTSDQPFKTTAAVQLTINENAPITVTHSHVSYQKRR